MTSRRCFIAIGLDPTSQSRVGSLIERLNEKIQGWRWISPENAHITVKFLGEVDENAVSTIAKLLEQSCEETRPVFIEMRGLGVFPRIQSPRILWLGLAGQLDGIHQLFQRLDKSLIPLAWNTEKQDWVPHITLARLAEPRKTQVDRRTRRQASDDTNREWTRLLSEYADVSIGNLQVEHVDLMESKLKPTGPAYQRLFRCELKAAQGPEEN